MNISFHRQWGEETHLTSRLHTLRRSWGRNWETCVRAAANRCFHNMWGPEAVFSPFSWRRRRESTASMSMWSCCMKTSRRRSEGPRSSSSWPETRTTWRSSFRTVPSSQLQSLFTQKTKYISSFSSVLYLFMQKCRKSNTKMIFHNYIDIHLYRDKMT